MTTRALCIILVFFLSACAGGVKYQPPEVNLPADWGMRISNGKASSLRWWEKLHDKTLNGLIERGLKGNYDLKTAEARILEEKALRGGTVSKFFPQINGTASGASLGGQKSTGGVNAPDRRATAGIDASWELDLFGKNRRRLDANNASVEAVEAQRDGLTLSIISEIARNYVEVRSLQQLTILTKRNLKMQQETLKATTAQFEAQAVGKLDVLRAQAQVNATTARLPEIDTELAIARHRLEILVGESPASLDALLKNPKPLPFVQEKAALDTPVQVIGRRPDVRAAERRLAEAASLKNESFTGLFPKVSLSGVVAAGSSAFYGASAPWSLGASALLPLLNFGGVRSEIDAADARQQQAFNSYQQTVLLALEDVENALVSYRNEYKRASSLQGAVTAHQEAAKLARIKYEAGDATFLDVLVEEDSLLNAESEMLASQTNTIQNFIALYKAMGAR